MLKITNHQESINQNHSETSPHPFQNAYYAKHSVTNAGKYFKGRELLYILRGARVC